MNGKGVLKFQTMILSTQTRAGQVKSVRAEFISLLGCLERLLKARLVHNIHMHNENE